MEVIQPEEMLIYVVEPGEEMFLAYMWFPIRLPKQISMSDSPAYYDIDVEREIEIDEIGVQCELEKSYNQSCEFVSDFIGLIHYRY